MEVATKEDFNQLRSELLDAITKRDIQSDKLILDLSEVKRRTGYSDKIIQDLIQAGKLNPWKEGDKNSKLRFYAKEVMSIIPQELREKYG